MPTRTARAAPWVCNFLCAAAYLPCCLVGTCTTAEFWIVSLLYFVAIAWQTWATTYAIIRVRLLLDRTGKSSGGQLAGCEALGSL